MGTVMRFGKSRVVIYPNDHEPAHVHVIGPGWRVVINLLGPEIRETINCADHEARSVLREIADHTDELMKEWRRIHGC